MKIRLARYDDVDTIEELLYEVHDVHQTARPDLFKKGHKKYSRDEIIAIMNNSNTPIYVYENNGIVLGYAFVIYLNADKESLVQIKSMYIDDLCVSHKSRHMGIGSIIMHDLEEVARDNDCYNILLNVYNFNKSAFAFYEKQGMSPLKTYMEKIVK